MFTFLFLWIPFCIAVGMFASIRRNRSGFGWFLFAFFLSPLLGIIFVAILKPREKGDGPVHVAPDPRPDFNEQQSREREFRTNLLAGGI